VDAIGYGGGGEEGEISEFKNLKGGGLLYFQFQVVTKSPPPPPPKSSL